MFDLEGANEFSVVGSILRNNGKKLSTLEIQKRKFMYLEGLIRFLELYGQNEIGNVEVDIEKIALWINSPYFENVDLYKITSIDKVYKMITDDLFNNVPLYRFLKLSPYQMKIFEQNHYDILLEEFEKDCDRYQCLKCFWYENAVTSFGTLSKCRLPKDRITRTISFSRTGYHNIATKKNRTCEYCCNTLNKDSWIKQYITENKNLPSVYHHSMISDLTRYEKNWLEKVKALDNSCIPIITDIHVDISKEDDMWTDLGRVFGNKKPMEEMKTNLRFAIFLEAMIKFVEIYAQTEVGNDYVANISKIAKYLSDKKFNFKSKEEFYNYLENEIINGFNITKFCRRKLT